MWVGAGMRERELGRVERRRAREDRQQVAVRPDPEEQQVEHGPAVTSLEAGRAQLVGERGRAPRGAAGRADRLAGREGVDVVDRERHTRPVAAGGALLVRADAEHDVVERP